MQLLEHFKTLTVHPKNAQELKGLIVQLALQGSLTKKWREENSNVKPASQLLKNIQDDKTRLIEKRKLKVRQVSEIKDTVEMKYEIPRSWSWYNLSEVVFFQEGPGIRKWQFRETGVKLLNVQNVVGDTLVLNNTDKHVEEKEYLEKYQHFTVEEGDLLFASSGGSWGKSAWFKDPGYKVMLNTSMVRLCFYGKNWFADYLKTFISSSFFKKQMTHQLVGIQPNFGSTHLSRVYIPIPPLEEQKAIVATVNQLFKEVEALEEQTKARVQLKEDFVTSALQELATGDTVKEWSFLQEHFKTFFTEKPNIKKLRESILQLAVQGKLTHHWRTQNPTTEDAAELLENLETKKAHLIAEKLIKKDKKIPSIYEEKNLPELPSTWVWCRMGQVGNAMNSAFVDGPFGSSINTKRDYIEEGVPVLRMANVKPYRFKGKELKYISEEKYQGFLRHGVIAGDILFSKVGAGIGESCIVPDSFEYGMLSTTGISRFRVGQIVLNDYLCHFINGNETYFKGLSQNSAQPFLNMTHVRSTPFPLPPLKEQKAIVEKVNALMGLCDDLEKAIEDSTTQVEQLMQSCLKEIFEA